MSAKKSVMFVFLTTVLCSKFSFGNVISGKTANQLAPSESLELRPVPKSLFTEVSGKGVTAEVGLPNTNKLGQELANLAESLFWPEEQDGSSFEGRRKKYKKHEMMMLTKMLMGLKIALLGIVLPLGVVSAQVLSWKAVTLSLLAYMLAKIVFVKNLFMAKPTPPPGNTQSPPPLAPIIIQGGTPSHDTVWKRHTQPKIHLQPEVHVHQAKDDHPAPSWGWHEEGRAASDPHVLAFGSWLPATKATPVRPKD